MRRIPLRVFLPAEDGAAYAGLLGGLLAYWLLGRIMLGVLAYGLLGRIEMNDMRCR